MPALKVKPEEIKWSEVSSDLATSKESITERINQLRTERKSHVLWSLMGNAKSKARLAEIDRELPSLERQLIDLDLAIAAAADHEREQAQNEEVIREKQRQHEIRAALTAFHEVIKRIDLELHELSGSFRTARELLDKAENQMTPQERQAFQQLRSSWGPTLAAAHHGLGDYIELGPRATHRTHRQPLETYVANFVGRWLE
jgi:chromosome segregation ATPase